MAEEKADRMGEIKFMYKKCDESKFAERDNELAKVKEEMEQLKAQKV